MTLAYQLLALGPSKKTRCENAASLLYLIRGFTKLWRTPLYLKRSCELPTDKQRF
jgi:hypothetical protein